MRVRVGRGDLSLTEEPVTITIAVAQHASDTVTDFNTKYAIAQANEVTGVNIEWIPVLEGNNEQVATLLAAICRTCSSAY